MVLDLWSSLHLRKVGQWNLVQHWQGSSLEVSAFSGPPGCSKQEYKVATTHFRTIMIIYRISINQFQVSKWKFHFKQKTSL